MKRAFLILVALLIASIAVNVWQWRNHPKESTVIEHDTVWKDSIIREPVAAETVRTERVVYIKLPVGDTQGTGTAVPSKDSTGESQSPCVANGSDSMVIALPIEQKRYEDSLYTAWVSGFQARLDSIRLRLPEVHTTVNKTVVKPTPSITVGIQAGGGYGVFNRKPDFYIGVGAQVNLWRK